MYTTETESSSATETEKAPSRSPRDDVCMRYVCITFWTTAIIVGVLVSVIWYLFYVPEFKAAGSAALHGNSTHDGKQARMADISFKVHLAKSLMNFDDGVEYCRRKNMKIIVPLDQTNENELIRVVKDLKQASYCRDFLFGYKATTAYRYKSPRNNRHWPSFSESIDVIQPTPDKVCAEVQMGKVWQVVQEVSCTSYKVDCVLLLETIAISKRCERHPFASDCIVASGKLKGSDQYSIADHYTMFKQNNPNIYGVLPIDSQNIPETVLQYKPSTRREKCYAISMRYDFIYESILNSSKWMSYKSEHFSVIDPEYNCLGIDKTRNYKVVTMYCKNPSCILCH